MKKILCIIGVLVLGIYMASASNTGDQVNNGLIVDGVDCGAEAQFGTFNDACVATRDIGKHATLVGWNLVKIPFIPLKHIILQFVDGFCAIKDVVKHSALIGYSFIRLGGDLIAIPIVQGYEHPWEACIAVTALLAAGGVYEGYALVQDLSPESWDVISQSLNIFA